MKALDILISSKQQVQICPITGLASYISIPAIQGKYIDFPNPLASIEVIQQYAVLSYKELQELPKDVLAALILGTLHQNWLISKVSAYHVNKELQTLETITLVKSFKLIASLLYRKEKAYPALSITSLELAVKDFQSYTKLLRQLLEGTYWEENQEASSNYTSNAIAIIKPKLSTKQLDSFKAALKIHLAVLKQLPTFPNKLLELMTLITKNEALKTVSPEISKKIITILRRDYPDVQAAKSFANILEKAIPANKETNLGESAITTTEKPKTLSEILAAKTRTREEAEATWTDEIQETSYTVDMTEETEEDFKEEEEYIISSQGHDDNYNEYYDSLDIEEGEESDEGDYENEF